jgi:hypothetical protein
MPKNTRIRSRIRNTDCNYIDILSAAVPHPCKQVVEKTWPALSKCCDKFADDERITERACRTIRSVVSAG